MKKVIITIILIAIIIPILIFIGYKLTTQGKEMLNAAGLQDVNTNMLRVQAKAKNIKDQSILKNDVTILKGTKLTESDKEYIKKLKETGVIKEDEVNYKDYYIWDSATLQELNLNIKLAEGENYIVNYETNEVITTKAFKMQGAEGEHYKLTDIPVVE